MTLPMATDAMSRWRPTAFDLTDAALPVIEHHDAQPILPALDLWDSWPLERRDGTTVSVDGVQWWFFLSSPRFSDPGLRHDAARIRLVRREADGRWTDLGMALPDDANPGSREWAGSAVLDDDGVSVTLYFTAAGRRGEAPSFEQRLFAITGHLGGGTIGDWSAPVQMVASDGVRYAMAREATGLPGAIKAFRDPAFFHDPATGRDHILFAGSAGWDDDPFNGVVGVATRDGDRWRLDDPLIDAVGINNELERPHIRVLNGRYYLFFSTQGRTFSDNAVRGPNGLYALVADRIDGPWHPVNGSGLIAANPVDEPTQAYSWWVTGEGRVTSFIDHWGMAGRSFDHHPALLRDQFGGTPAPWFALACHGDSIAVTPV
jgi:levansucrase